MSKLTLKEKASYGLGDFGTGFMFDMGQIYLLKFYTDVFGIPPAAAGTVFIITKIFDAFMDPLAGIFVDTRHYNTATSSKFRHIMFRGSIFLGILSILVFSAPNLSASGKIIFAYATYMAWGACYSFTTVPYSGLGAAMTQDPSDRASLASWRQAAGAAAFLITSVFPILLIQQFSNAKTGWHAVIALSSIVGVIGFYFCFKNCREVIIVKPASASGTEKKLPFKAMGRAIYTNKPLLVIIIMILFTISAGNIGSALMIYYCQYNLGNITFMPYISLLTVGCSFMIIPFMPRLVVKAGKKATAITGLLIASSANALNYAFGTSTVLFIVFACIASMGLSLANGVIWVFLSDVIDFGQWRTGVRREGITCSFFNFSRKIGQSLSGFIAGFGLSFVGYVPNAQQTHKTLSGIRMLFLLYPAAAFLCAAMVILVLYNLNEKKHADIISDLHKCEAVC